MAAWYAFGEHWQASLSSTEEKTTELKHDRHESWLKRGSVDYVNYVLGMMQPELQAP